MPNTAYFVAWFSVIYSFAKLELFELKFPMLPICYSEFSEKPLSNSGRWYLQVTNSYFLPSEELVMKEKQFRYIGKGKSCSNCSKQRRPAVLTRDLRWALGAY